MLKYLDVTPKKWPGECFRGSLTPRTHTHAHTPAQPRRFSVLLMLCPLHGFKPLWAAGSGCCGCDGERGGLRSTSPLTLLGAGMQTGDNKEFHTREETWRRSGGEVGCCRHGVSRERTSELRPGCTGVTTQGCRKKRDRWGQQVCLQKGKKAGVGNGWRQVWLNSVAGIARESQ